MDGIILVNKPKNFTSHDIVKKIKGILNKKKAGHFGTLDPMATGLMIVGIGKATKLFPFYSKLTKIYKGQIELGYSTDTYDSEGKPTSEKCTLFPSEERINEIIKEYKGDILQTPPPYSAKKFKGKPLYKFAREKKEIKLPPSKVKIYYFNLLEYHPPYIDFETKCSSGTYIRSLAHEIGKKSGCGAHLSALIRTSISSFHIKESFTLEEIAAMTQKNMNKEFLIPLENLLPEFPKIILSERGAEKARNGASIKLNDSLSIDFRGSLNKNSEPSQREQTFRLFSSTGKFIALARKRQKEGKLHPFTVMDARKPLSSNKGESHAK